MAIPYFHTVIFAAWFAWLIFWAVSAINIKRAVRQESAASKAAHLLPLALAALLLWVPVPIVMNLAFLPVTAPFAWAGVVVTLTGLLFSIWARHYLGKNWGGEQADMAHP